MLHESSHIPSLLQPKCDGSFRGRILTLLDEHERVALEHNKLQLLLKDLRRDPAHDLDRMTPCERHESDLLPAADCQWEPTWQDAPSERMITGGSEDGVVFSSERTREQSLHSSGDGPMQVDSMWANADMDIDIETETSHNRSMFSRLSRNSTGSTARLDHVNTDEFQEDINEIIAQKDRTSRERSRRKTILASESTTSFDGRSPFRIVVRSRHFEGVVAVIILTNVIYMGWAANYMIGHPEEMETHAMKVVNLVFCIVYTCEVAIRIIAWGRDYFRSSDSGWNFFDLLLVVQSVFEEASYWSGLEGSIRVSGMDMTFLRALRLCKLVKMLRIVRLMKSMREMRLILFSIMGSIKGMFWSLALIFFVLFMFALVFVQACADYLEQEHFRQNDVELDVETKKGLVYYFGSVQGGMSSLFWASTGGVDWGVVADPLLPVSRVYYALFYMYIAFFLVVLMNTITALFVETTFTNASRDHHYTIQNLLEKKAEYIDLLKLLFAETDTDGDGLISESEFCAKLDDPKMRAFAEALHIEITDARYFFDLISEQGKKDIDLDSFVSACIKMRGQALSLDLQDLAMKQKKANDFHQLMQRDLSQNLAVLHSEFKEFKSFQSTRSCDLEGNGDS